MDKKKIILCRCEDVDLETIHERLDQGFTTYEDLKRLTRVGMGPCQGTTCVHLIRQEIAYYCQIPLSEVKSHKSRPFLQGVPMKKLAGDLND